MTVPRHERGVPPEGIGPQTRVSVSGIRQSTKREFPSTNGETTGKRVRHDTHGSGIENFLLEHEMSEKPPLRPEILDQADITVEKLEKNLFGFTDSFVAEEYVKFHKGYDFVQDIAQTQGHRDLMIEVMEQVCRDEYSIGDYSTTFMASSENIDYLGSIRFDEAQEGATYPLETQKLWKLKGRRSWPHGKKKAGDLGRVVVHNRQRPENTAVVLKSLTDNMFDYAREKGIDHIYFTTQTDPPRLLKRIKEIGLKPKRVRGVELNYDDPEAKELFDTFDEYWVNQKPQLFVIKVPKEKPRRTGTAIDIFISRRNQQEQIIVPEERKAA
ncbi:MAG TPA: hypothetical protein VNA13_04335 [Xanthomonadales bacterium]|nr:hypothetical protein [Xanthomonadales bacterium]